MLRLLLLALSLYNPRPDFDGCVRYWQRELYLQDWKITVQTVSRAELADGTVGDIQPDPRTRVAKIRVLRESDYELPRRTARADQRLTIAHEMVHLRRLAYPRTLTWQNEAETDQELLTELQRHSRWRELSVFERD